jgi:hypothetical protein
MMIETYERKSKFALLKPYDFMSGENDFIEVTEWHNGEGFDVMLERKCGVENFSLTWGQWEAVQALVAYRA